MTKIKEEKTEKTQDLRGVGTNTSKTVPPAATLKRKIIEETPMKNKNRVINLNLQKGPKSYDLEAVHRDQLQLWGNPGFSPQNFPFFSIFSLFLNY